MQRSTKFDATFISTQHATRPARTVASMVALLKYGNGLPFNRLDGLQENLGMPLPSSTQWEIVAEASSSST